MVTGAAGGLGRCIVDEFVANGWSVIGVDLDNAPQHEACEHWVGGDLTEPAVRYQLTEMALDGLDALVNNAALQLNSSLADTSDSAWSRSLDVNLTTAFQLIRDLSPALSSTRGGVVNVGSVHAIASSENVFPYAVSKAAMTGLTRSSALELAGAGVRCNAVLLGAVDTPMLRDGLGRREHAEGPEGNLRTLVERTPLGFLAEPLQVVGTIRFLADTYLSPYTTGQAVVVDGGASLRLATE